MILYCFFFQSWGYSGAPSVSVQSQKGERRRGELMLSFPFLKGARKTANTVEGWEGGDEKSDCFNLSIYEPERWNILPK